MKWLDPVEAAVFEACRTLPDGAEKWPEGSTAHEAAMQLWKRGVLYAQRQNESFVYLRPTKLALEIWQAVKGMRG
jgi:hypothetical protein